MSQAMSRAVRITGEQTKEEDLELLKEILEAEEYFINQGNDTEVYEFRLVHWGDLKKIALKGLHRDET